MMAVNLILNVSDTISEKQNVAILWAYCTLTSLVLAPFPHLRLKSALDSVDTTSTTTRLTCYKEYPIFFREKRVWRLARFTGDVLDNIPSEYIFNLLLLETTLDHQPAGTVNTSCGSHFRK